MLKEDKLSVEGMSIANKDKVLLKKYYNNNKDDFNDLTTTRVNSILDDIHDAAHIKRNEIFFEEYKSNETYQISIKPFFVEMEKEDILSISFMTASNQKVIIDRFFINKIPKETLNKILLQQQWLDTEIKIKELKKQGYIICPQDLKFKVKYDPEKLRNVN